MINIFRYFLIKWADRGLVHNGFLNTHLFKVSFCLIYLNSTPASHLQVLFWLQSIFMFINSIVNYPFSFKFLPEYPFNNLRGHLCSGLGIHSSKTMEKEMTGHLALLFGVPLYKFSIYYFTFKIKRFIKQFTSKGSGASINGLCR